MSITRTVLMKSIIKPFYRQHAGLFVFLFIVLFGAVGMVDGAGLMAFHVSLIRGMLKNANILMVVFLIWLLYAKKTEQFVSNILRRPDFSFLQMLSQLDVKTLYALMVWLQFLLLLPIIFYTLIIFTAGLYFHEYSAIFIILGYILMLIILFSGWYSYMIKNPGKFMAITGKFTFKSRKTPYWSLFIRYICRNKKLLYAGIKTYSCVVLFLMVINQTRIEYDLSMILLFFSLGILGHGLLIHQLRDLEETRLTFYRTVPLSLLGRFTQYSLIYFILLIPEIITISLLTPYYLHYSDAIIFVLFSYSILMFLNSLLFIQFFRMKDYLKIILCIFLLIYLCVLTLSIPWLCIFLFLSSIAIFYRRYYQFER
jgi:hypothetical protein